MEASSSTGASRRSSNMKLLRLVVSALALAGAFTGAAPLQAQAPCQFVLGFAALHDAIPAEVGDCLDNQTFAPNGNGEQRTTKGLMVWRKADNWTAFTNGYATWVNGPNGLQRRLNTECFPFESCQAPQPPPPGQPGTIIVVSPDRPQVLKGTGSESTGRLLLAKPMEVKDAFRVVVDVSVSPVNGVWDRNIQGALIIDNEQADEGLRRILFGTVGDYWTLNYFMGNRRGLISDVANSSPTRSASSISASLQLDVDPNGQTGAVGVLGGQKSSLTLDSPLYNPTGGRAIRLGVFAGANTQTTISRLEISLFKP